MKVDVLILFEHRDRELESSLLLERKLEERGLTVKILQEGWNAAPASWFFQTKVLVTPWCYDSENLEHLRIYRGRRSGRRFSIVNTHCEQITSPDAMGFMLPSGRASDTYHLAWGRYFRDLLVESGVDPSSVCVTGSPRLDFFRPAYASISPAKVELAREFGLDTENVWALLIGNYSAAFLTEERISQLEARSMSAVRENATLAKQTYDATMGWYRDVAPHARELGVELIYRPHPSEPVTEQLQSIADDHRNFHIIKRLAIRDWLVNSDAAFMWNSTSSAEAAYAEVPVFSLRPYEIPPHLQFGLLESISQIHGVDELRDALAAVARGGVGDVNRNFVAELGRYYHRPILSAADLTADFIKRVIWQDEHLFTTRRPILFGARKTGAYVAKMALRRFGLLSKMPKYRVIADDYVSNRELRNMRRRIDELE